MKSIEIDINILRKILPLYITSYLEATNWQFVSKYENIASIWQKYDNDRNIKIIVPTDTEIADYISRILDIIKVLVGSRRTAKLKVLESNLRTRSRRTSYTLHKL